MQKKLIGIFFVMLLTVSMFPSVESLKDSTKISAVQGTDVIFGEISNLRTEDESIVFQALNIKVFRFDTLKLYSYNSGEYFEVSDLYKGVIGTNFIFVLTKIVTINAPMIACLSQNTSNTLLVAAAQSNLKWKNIAITTNNSNVSWRVFHGDFSRPIDGWNSTAFATTEIIAGDYVFLQFNQTTPSTDVKVTFAYIPTNSLIGTWTINI